MVRLSSPKDVLAGPCLGLFWAGGGGRVDLTLGGKRVAPLVVRGHYQGPLRPGLCSGCLGMKAHGVVVRGQRHWEGREPMFRGHDLGCQPAS